MLKNRILTALVGIPILMLVVYLGGITFALTVTLLSILGLREFFRLIRHMDMEPQAMLGFAGGLFLLLSAYSGINIPHGEVVALIMIGFLLSAVFIPQWSLTGSAVTLMAVLYIGLFRYLILLREMPRGFELVIALFILNWATDIGAYFTGRVFGRHLMAPRLSPKKTIEGAMGGILTSIAASLVMAWAGVQIPQLIILALLISVSGQLGDLVESAFKRAAGVKDAGRMLPGHGGVLDRFDSLLISLPLVYYYFQLFIIN
ncbi:MAG: phosphatidate cytidylyltransferase [Bacillota bacterium]